MSAVTLDQATAAARRIVDGDHDSYEKDRGDAETILSFLQAQDTAVPVNVSIAVENGSVGYVRASVPVDVTIIEEDDLIEDDCICRADCSCIEPCTCHFQACAITHAQLPFEAEPTIHRFMGRRPPPTSKATP